MDYAILFQYFFYIDGSVHKTRKKKKKKKKKKKTLQLNYHVTANMNLNNTIVIMKADIIWRYDWNPAFLCFCFGIY